MSAAQPINVAVLGFGMSATVFHLPFITALPLHFKLHTILERSATPTSSKARDAFSSAKIVNTIDEVIADNEIELVVVSTINDTHFAYAKAALEAGKHVIVEKPVAPTSQEARELAKLAEEKNLVLAVYQNRRWDADFLTIKDLIAKGEFGNLTDFESHFDRFKGEAATTKQWKEEALPGSGIVYDLGSHVVDQILTLFGRPTSVSAHIRNSRNIGNPDVPDAFDITLSYPALPGTKGRELPLLAHARGTMLSLINPNVRFIVRGTEGAFVKHGLDVQEDQLKAEGALAVAKHDFGVEPASASGTLYKQGGKQDKVTSHVGLYRGFFESVAEAIQKKDRSLLAVTPESAALTIEVLEAAIQAAKEGREIKL